MAPRSENQNSSTKKVRKAKKQSSQRKRATAIKPKGAKGTRRPTTPVVIPFLEVLELPPTMWPEYLNTTPVEMVVDVNPAFILNEEQRTVNSPITMWWSFLQFPPYHMVIEVDPADVLLNSF